MREIRWKQRFENFERAFLLFKDALKDGVDKLSDLEKEGVIQRFEYTFELAWKTLRDYLEYGGFVFEHIVPKVIIKQGFASRIIPDGEVWMNMLEQRNLMSHTYDKERFDFIMKNITEIYSDAIEHLYLFFKEIDE